MAGRNEELTVPVRVRVHVAVEGMDPKNDASENDTWGR